MENGHKTRAKFIAEKNGVEKQIEPGFQDLYYSQTKIKKDRNFSGI